MTEVNLNRTLIHRITAHAPWVRFGEIAKYLFVGGLTALVSIAQLWLYVGIAHWQDWIAYSIQAVVCIELNFWLNYTITWRTTRGGLWPKLVKFNLTRLATIPVSEAVYLALVWVQVNYQIANIVTIVGATVANFLVGQRYIFIHRSDTKECS